jgi:AhpD family alkylhydroperoxidase
MEGFDKKTWTLCHCLADHFSILLEVPKIFDAYVGPNQINAKLNESIMVTVNSVNNCPYCTGLHGELARMAGVDEAESLLNAKSEQEARMLVDAPAITFAHRFGEHDGRGEVVDDAFETLAKEMGRGQAGSVRALCWFLLWGSVGGNTINSFLFGRLCCSPKKNRNPLFELLFFVYYGPLFFLIFVVMKLLTIFPKVPECFSAGFGAFLTVVASIWILPLGLLACLTKPCHPEYTALPAM